MNANDYANRRVTYARDIRNCGRAVTLKTAVEMVRGGGDHSSDWRNVVKLCRAATSPDERNGRKSRLPAIYFSGEFQAPKKPAKERLTKHSGLMCLDIDGKDNVGATVNEMRAKVDTDPHTLASFISPSGDGLKVIVPVTATDAATHERCFATAAAYYAQRLGIAIDAQCKDVSRACFVSYDKDAILKDAAEPFAPAPQAPAAPAPNPAPAIVAPAPVVADEGNTRRAKAYLDTMPPAISGQHGHTALFKAAAALTVKFGLDDETAFALLKEHYNPRCQPPWSDKELRHKVTESRKAKQIRPLPERPNDEQFSVWADDAAMAAAGAVEPETEPAPAPLEEAFPRHLLALGGGVIDEFVEHATLSAKYPHATSNFAAALAFVSAMAGRRGYIGHIGNTPIYPREYFLTVAGPGAGKDQGRKLIKAIMRNVGAPGLIPSIASGEGLEDELIDAGGAALFMPDEVHGLLNAMADERPNPLTRALKTLLELYTTAGNGYKRRAMSKGNKNRKKDADEADNPEPYIDNPSLTWYGCTTPREFMKACNERLFSDGLFARCLVIKGDKRIKAHRKPERNIYDIPDGLLKFAQFCLSGEKIEVQCAPDAEKRMEAADTFADLEYGKAEVADCEAGQALWGRMGEHVQTLALLAAISRNYQNPMIAADNIEWALAVVRWAIQQLLAFRAAREIPLTLHRKQDLADMDKILKAMPQSGHDYKRSPVLKAFGGSAADFDKALATLIQRGQVTIAKKGNGGNVATQYRRL